MLKFYAPSEVVITVGELFSSTFDLFMETDSPDRFHLLIDLDKCDTLCDNLGLFAQWGLCTRFD